MVAGMGFLPDVKFMESFRLHHGCLVCQMFRWHLQIHPSSTMLGSIHVFVFKHGRAIKGFPLCLQMAPSSSWATGVYSIFSGVVGVLVMTKTNVLHGLGLILVWCEFLLPCSNMVSEFQKRCWTSRTSLVFHRKFEIVKILLQLIDRMINCL